MYIRQYVAALWQQCVAALWQQCVAAMRTYERYTWAALMRYSMVLSLCTLAVYSRCVLSLCTLAVYIYSLAAHTCCALATWIRHRAALGLHQLGCISWAACWAECQVEYAQVSHAAVSRRSRGIPGTGRAAVKPEQRGWPPHHSSTSCSEACTSWRSMCALPSST